MEDELVKKSVERIQRARIERKLCELQLRRGIINIKEFNNVSDLFKENKVKPMTFFTDSKNNIVTFDLIMPEEQKDKKRKEKLLEIKKHFRSMSQIPIVQLDVNLSETKKAKLLIYENDDAELISDTFCEKYNLSDDKRNYLRELIEDKINQFVSKKANMI